MNNLPLEPMFRELVIQKFAARLNGRGELISEESTLPFAKDVIRKAILEDLKDSTDPRDVAALKHFYVVLELFVDSAEYTMAKAEEAELNRMKQSANSSMSMEELITALDSDGGSGIFFTIMARTEAAADELKRLRV